MTNCTRSVGRFVGREACGASGAEAKMRRDGDLRDLVEEKGEDRVALRLWHPNDPAGEACQHRTRASVALFAGLNLTRRVARHGRYSEAWRICGLGNAMAKMEGRAMIGRRFTWVDVDALPASHRVHTYNGVDRLDGFTPHRLSSGTGAVCLCNTAVHCR